MYRNLLICLFASIALVCAQSTTNSTSIDEIKFNGTELAVNVTTTTTSAPKTTTLAPKTTTSKTEPPTTTKSPTTTTAKPSTTTVEPTPAPVPKPEQFSGNVTEDNKTCINVQFSVKITFKYNNTRNETQTTGFTIPANATVDSKSSHCGEAKNSTPEAITIGFRNFSHTSANLSLTFNISDNSVYVDELKLSFVATKDLMPGMDSAIYGKTLNAAKDKLSLFKVASVHSYVCSAGQSAQLDSQESRVSGVQIEFTDSKVEAYMDESKRGKFDSEIDCKSADISDVVPIAVGAALAGLVIIVLIAYFIGRRRSRRLAYQSV